MVLHVRWKSKFICMRGDLLNDPVFANSFVIELGGGARGVEVPAEEPD